MKVNQHSFVVGLMAGVLLAMSPALSAEDIIPLSKAREKIFPRAKEFKTSRIALTDDQISSIEHSADVIFAGTHSRELIVHRALDDNGTAGLVFEDTVMGKWGPIHYVVGIEPAGSIRSVLVLDYQEIRGRPVAKRRFLKQYKGKHLKDVVRLSRDIDGVTGATISSRSLTNGVRKLLHAFSILENELAGLKM